MKQFFRLKSHLSYCFLFTVFFLSVISPTIGMTQLSNPSLPKESGYQPRYQRPGSSYRPYSQTDKDRYPVRSQKLDPSLRPGFGEGDVQEELDIKRKEEGSAPPWFVPLEIKAIPGDTFVDVFWNLSPEKLREREKKRFEGGYKRESLAI